MAKTEFLYPKIRGQLKKKNKILETVLELPAKQPANFANYFR